MYFQTVWGKKSFRPDKSTLVKFRHKHATRIFPESSQFCRLLDEIVDKTFFIDLDSIRNKLLSDYSLNLCFSGRFPTLMINHFPSTNPYKMSGFERSVACSLFFSRCTSPIDKNLEEKV